MAVAIVQESNLPSPEGWYSSMTYFRQQQQLKIQEAGKAIIAAGSRWPRTVRSRTAALVTEIPEYDQKTYEKMYVRIGILHQAVNMMSETLIESGMMFGAPSHLLQDNEWDLSSVPTLKPNIQTVSRWSRYIKLPSKLIALLKPALWAGNGYAEVVYDEEDDWKITHFKILNPREMRVVRDKTGEVLGYVQFPFNSPLSILSEDMRDFYLLKGAVFLEKDDIIHLKWNPLPGAAYGQSIFEPVKDDAAIVVGMREDMGMIVKNNAAPTTHYRLGTDNIPAGKTSVTNFANDITAMDWTVDLVTSTMVDSKPLKDPSKIMDVPHYLQQALNMFFAALGLPEIMFGQGNETTEATAKYQIEAAQKKFRAIQRMLRDQLELFIFSRLLDEIDHDALKPEDMDTIPEIYFAPIETVEEKRLRLERGVELGSLAHEDYRKAWGYIPKRSGQVVLAEDREYQLELAKTSPPQATLGSPASKKDGKSQSTKTDRSSASKAKKGKTPKK